MGVGRGLCSMGLLIMSELMLCLYLHVMHNTHEMIVLDTTIDSGSGIKWTDSETTWTHCIHKTLPRKKLMSVKSSSMRQKGLGIGFRMRRLLDRVVCLPFGRMSFGDLVVMMKVSRY